MLTVYDLKHMLSSFPDDAVIATRENTDFGEHIVPVENVELSEGWSDGTPRVLVWA